ncbi:flavin reductase family protein [Desulfovibrio sp. TomC]|uniref:flavin reductase family protein n=1 Tax=Desulfovibrio sp. TomC TaxID=1562888 RepID=UPI00057359BB|nr:flavin reductase family protein [Desulfovibrio sp. TomC]KHK00869.1 flavoredoxin [Desulfovibrio sp. TomC]
MEKVRLDPAQLPPMPVALAGTLVAGRVNFMAAGWITRVSHRPPLIGVSINHRQLTGSGIKETGAFSLCFPGPALVEKTDYCGLVSGRNVDKSALFDVFYGETPGAPMIRECPLCLEMRLYQTVELPSNRFFIGEIKAAWADEEILTDGQPDVEKYQPLLLTMPDNRYWTLGASVADAWSVGKTLKMEMQNESTGH